MHDFQMDQSFLSAHYYGVLLTISSVRIRMHASFYFPPVQDCVYIYLETVNEYYFPLPGGLGNHFNRYRASAK